MPPDQFFTVGEMATEIGQPLHRILYIIKSRGVEPAARVGRVRAFNREQVRAIDQEIARIDRRAVRPGCEEVSDV